MPLLEPRRQRIDRLDQGLLLLILLSLVEYGIDDLELEAVPGDPSVEEELFPAYQLIHDIRLIKPHRTDAA